MSQAAPSRRPPSHSRRAWERAEALVIEEGLGLEEAAARVGIPYGTLKVRAAKEEWIAVRDGRKSYKDLVVRLKVKALRKAVKDPTSENIQAWTSVERTYPEKTYSDDLLHREKAILTAEGFTDYLKAQGVPTSFLEELGRWLAMWFEDLK